MNALTGRFRLPFSKPANNNRKSNNQPTMREQKWRQLERSSNAADICLIVEGCYPFVKGGVSSWLQWLMNNQPQFTFSVVAIFPGTENLTAQFDAPDNLVAFKLIGLQDFGKASSYGQGLEKRSDRLSELILQLFQKGGLDELSAVDELINDPSHPFPQTGGMNSPFAWDLICGLYTKTMPQASFHHFFWASRALLGGMFNIMRTPIPQAALYHTISTGYAGLLAARAKIEMGKPVLISEHGIYTNERRIEVLMADWIADTVDKGLSMRDDRYDLRDLWIQAFDAQARACYQACDEITTLYGGNQELQRLLGAPEDKLTVIANGIDLDRFTSLPKEADHPPTVALIGRVVPIKDIKSYIRAVHKAHHCIPDLVAYVIGPTDEDEEYYAECKDLVEELGVYEIVQFTGNVQLTDYFPQLDLVMLTSLSEAQPLVLLEAGAAAIPCIATDVGSCREILEGRAEEHSPCGPGGIVTGLVDFEQMANAIVTLLKDHNLRETMGKNLQSRVTRYYASGQSAAGYTALYKRHGLTERTVGRGGR